MNLFAINSLFYIDAKTTNHHPGGGELKYIVDIDQIEIGDIILTSQNHPISKAVRIGTLSSVSHVLMCVARGSYIHSDAEGVHAGNFQRLLFDKKNYAQVMRLIDPDQHVISEAVRYARSQVNKQYSVIEAIKTVVPKIKVEENRQFCSRLIAQAYKAGGCLLVNNPDYCTPDHILNSDKLRVIPNIVRQARQDEILFAKTDNYLERQTDITNQLFYSIQKLTKADIQTIEQLVEFLISNPRHDMEVFNILMNSGYIKMIDWDIERNAWRYDVTKFLKFFEKNTQSEVLYIAQQEISYANEMIKRWGEEKIKYEDLTRNFRLETFYLMLNLYNNLVNSQMKRVEVSLAVIALCN